MKVLGASGGGSYSDIVAALDWLAAWSNVNGKRIQVASFSLGSARDPGTIVKAAFDNAYNNYNILSFGAAGNSGNVGGGGDRVIYPARWDSVVAVAATDRGDRRASFSSTGPAVELAAPGVNIWSAQPSNGNSYGYMSGTSMATPHVSGAAALVIAQVGTSAKNSDIRTRLDTSARDLGSTGRDQQYGYGLVDPLSSTNTPPYSLNNHN
jgi:subtilisin